MAQRPGVQKLFKATSGPNQTYSSFVAEYDSLPDRDRKALIDDLKYS